MLETVQAATLVGMFGISLAVGLLFAVRTDRALALQGAHAERAGTTTLPEDADHDEATRDHRRLVARFGGVVLALVGAGGLLAVGYWLVVG